MRRRCLGNHDQEVHAEDETRKLGIGHRGRFPQCSTEATEINEGTVGFQPAGKNGGRCHDADVEGLGSACVGEFRDIVSDAASLRGIETAVGAKPCGRS